MKACVSWSLNNVALLQKLVRFYTEKPALLYREKLSEQASIKVNLTYIVREELDQRISVTALVTKALLFKYIHVHVKAIGQLSGKTESQCACFS
jgi:hypothetical protein